MSKQAPNFVKPSGVEVYVSPESQEYAKSLGWRDIEEVAAEIKAKADAAEKAKEAAEAEAKKKAEAAAKKKEQEAKAKAEKAK